MNEYAAVYDLLALPDALRGCATGAIALPSAFAEAPAWWYGFPPALVPLWSETSSPCYFGYWKHWFVEREPTFVQMYVESSLVLEVARNPGQLFALAAIRAIVECDEVSPRVEAFAAAVGIDNLGQIDTVSLDTGDGMPGLAGLDQFAADLPRACLPEAGDYNGQYPASARTPVTLPRTSQYELDIDALAGWLASPDCPPWLSTRPPCRLALCRAYIAQRAFGLAWLTINARGWPIADARTALAELAAAAGDPQFAALASAWLSVASDSAGGY